VRIFLTIAGDRTLPSVAPGAGAPRLSLSSNSRTIGALSCESFTRPRLGAICRSRCCRYPSMVARSSLFFSAVASHRLPASTTVTLSLSAV